MADLSQADPLSLTLTWLQTHAVVLAEFGGASHVSGLNEAPYPHIRVAPGLGGDDRDLTWITDPEVLIEVYGDPDGSPGSAELRRLLYVALAAVKQLESDPRLAGETVVTRVTSASRSAWSPLPLGQPRWVAGLRFTLHPAMA